jgi:N-acetylmuramoyl-L-alanine amidase
MSPFCFYAAVPQRSLARGFFILALMALLTACGTGGQGRLKIDRSVQAKSQNSRIEFIVLHYTSTGNEASLKTLSEDNVSSHYFITDEARPRLYQLVDEDRRAWHAGLSQWYGRTHLNSSSIGIEIVNSGLSSNGWAAYNPAQIRILITLVNDIARRHGIKAVNIVGHSDIAPQRKIDPGPLFPWRVLAAAGIGRWYDESMAERYQVEFAQSLPDIAWIQEALSLAGYAVPQSGVLDLATVNVIAAFQMHYRPSLHDGLPDPETLAILKALH